jgi:hypothetical protein
VARGVVEVFTANSQVLSELRFIDLKEAVVYEFMAEASLGGVGTRALNADYASAQQTSGKDKPIREGCVILGGGVLTDRQMLAMKANRIAKKAKAAACHFSKLFFAGDSTVVGTDFDGLAARCKAKDSSGVNLTRYAVGTANCGTSGQDTNGGLLDLDVLTKMILRVPGPASQKRLYMGVNMQVRLGAIIRAQAATRIMVVDWAGNLTPAAYDGVKIVDSGEDETRQYILDFNETRGSATTSTASIFCAALGGQIDGEMVQGIARTVSPTGVGNTIFEVENQGIRGTQDIALVEGRLGLAVHHDRCIQRYAGILDVNK